MDDNVQTLELAADKDRDQTKKFQLHTFCYFTACLKSVRGNSR